MNAQPSLFARALRLFREQPGLYLAVAAIPYATLYPALYWLLFKVIPFREGHGSNLRDIWLRMTFGDTAAMLVVLFLWVMLPHVVAGRGLCRTAANQIENRLSTFTAIATNMAAFLPSALLLAIIVGCICFLAAMLMFVPAFFAAAAFSLVVPASAIENLGPFAALRRGLSTVTRTYGRLLLLFFLFNVVVFAALIVQGIVLGLLPHLLLVRIGVMAAIAAVLLTPLVLYNLCLTLTFYDSRAITPAPQQIPAPST